MSIREPIASDKPGSLEFAYYDSRRHWQHFSRASNLFHVFSPLLEMSHSPQCIWKWLVLLLLQVLYSKTESLLFFSYFPYSSIPPLPGSQAQKAVKTLQRACPFHLCARSSCGNWLTLGWNTDSLARGSGAQGCQAMGSQRLLLHMMVLPLPDTQAFTSYLSLISRWSPFFAAHPLEVKS